MRADLEVTERLPTCLVTTPEGRAMVPRPRILNAFEGMRGQVFWSVGGQIVCLSEGEGVQC